MPRYKRSAAEASLDNLPAEPAVSPEHAETMRTLRNMWEFASLMQYIFLFGGVVKIDEDFDIEVMYPRHTPEAPQATLCELWEMERVAY